MDDILLPLEYLLTSSQRSLEAFELSRLACSSNLRKEICQVLDEWVEAEVGARLTRWILEQRRTQEVDSSTLLPRREGHVGPEQLALFFLPTHVEVTSRATLCADSIILAPQASLENISPPRSARPSFYERAPSVAGLHAYGVPKSAMALNSPSHRVRPFSSQSALTLKRADAALRLLEHLGRGPHENAWPVLPMRPLRTERRQFLEDTSDIVSTNSPLDVLQPLRGSFCTQSPRSHAF